MEVTNNKGTVNLSLDRYHELTGKEEILKRNTESKMVFFYEKNYNMGYVTETVAIERLTQINRELNSEISRFSISIGLWKWILLYFKKQNEINILKIRKRYK